MKLVEMFNPENAMFSACSCTCVGGGGQVVYGVAQSSKYCGCGCSCGYSGFEDNYNFTTQNSHSVMYP